MRSLPDWMEFDWTDYIGIGLGVVAVGIVGVTAFVIVDEIWPTTHYVTCGPVLAHAYEAEQVSTYMQTFDGGKTYMPMTTVTPARWGIVVDTPKGQLTDWENHYLDIPEGKEACITYHLGVFTGSIHTDTVRPK